MKPLLMGLFWALVYFALSYGILTVLRVPPRRLLPYSLIPLILIGVVWTVWGFIYSPLGGAMIAVFLVFAGALGWIIKRVML